MRKISLHTLIAVLSLSLSVVAYAETNTSASAEVNAKASIKPVPIMQVRQELQDKRAEVKGEMRTMRAEDREDTEAMRAEDREKMQSMRGEMASTTKAVREEMLENRIDTRIAHVTTRLEATISREVSIMEKVNSRIEKIKAGGVDTTDAEKIVAEAKTHFDEATSALASLKTIASGIDSSVTATTSLMAIGKTTLTNLQKGAMEVQMHIREGHKALEKSVISLRASIKVETKTTN